MFLSRSICGLLSIENTVTFAYSPFLVYFFCHALKRVRKADYRLPLAILVWAVVFVLVKRVIGQDYFKTYLCFLGFPMMVAMCLQSEKRENIDLLRRLMLLFFIVECGLAIYEKIMGYNVFPDKTDTMTVQQLMYYNPEAWQFRSGSLWGHPLANAMIVAVFMSFIVISNLELKYKIPLMLLGYVSLYCFNARGATLVVSVLIMPVLVYQVQRSHIRYRKWIYLLLAVIACYLLHILMNTSLGGRIFSGEKLLDGSAQTRLDVFKFTEYISVYDLFLGSPDLYLFVMHKLQAGGVENGIITMILAHGLIITVIILCCLFRFQYQRLMLAYTRMETFWLLSVFYLIGVMNPNLSVPTQWTFWILCYYVFRNEGKTKMSTYGKENYVS